MEVWVWDDKCRVYRNQGMLKNWQDGQCTEEKLRTAGKVDGLQGVITVERSEYPLAVEDGTVDTVEQQTKRSSGGELLKECSESGLQQDSRFLLLLTDGKGLEKASIEQLVERATIRLLQFAYNGVLWSGERPLPEIGEFSIEDMRNVSERNLAFLKLLNSQNKELLIIMLSYASLNTLMKTGLDNNGQTLREMGTQSPVQTYGAKELKVVSDSIYQLIDWRLITYSNTSVSHLGEQYSKESQYISTVSPETFL